MDGSDAGLTRVRILDQFYNIRSEGDPAYVRRLAEYVDQKLRQVSEATPSVDTLKVAILTALNIADELFRAIKVDSGDEDWYCQKLRECNLLLDELVK